MSAKRDFSISRRDFLATTTAAAIAAALPASAQTPAPAPSTGPWTRVSLTDPAAPAMLASYGTAVTALLKLGATDGLNFYRNAFIHTLDCPHGNWWFLPWHRGYLGWWEQTVRLYSGNPNFAFPYWDWTAQPFVPDAFWSTTANPNNPLDPSSSIYYSSYSAFQSYFSAAMTQFYSGLSAAQQQQLTYRGLNTANLFWQAAAGDWANPARTLTEQNNSLPDQTAVNLATIQQALQTPFFAGDLVTTFGGFGSDYAAQHSGGGSEGILESQPHDNVHGDIGGFMGAFLSPIDPIFMAHHANIDRLWTVWTAQQQAAGQPTLPTFKLTTWQNEPFLFYVDSQGNPVTQNTASAYETPSLFNYNYTQGSPLPSATAETMAAKAFSESSVRRVTGTVRAAQVNFSQPAVAHVVLPEGTAASAGLGRRRVRAHLTIERPANTRGIRFHVFVNPPQNEATLESSHPSYAGTIQFFGNMHHQHATTFTVPLEKTLADLRAANALPTGDTIDIYVVAQSRAIALRALPPVSVTKVEISTF